MSQNEEEVIYNSFIFEDNKEEDLNEYYENFYS